QARRLLEQPAVVILDATEMKQQRIRELLGTLVAGEAGESLQFEVTLGQRVRLLVVDHLQAMLDDAQETIGLDHVFGDLERRAAGARERAQRVAGAARAQTRVAAPEDQLLGLRKEFDLANAAAPELHIVTGDGDIAGAAMGVDLPLDRVD